MFVEMKAASVIGVTQIHCSTKMWKSEMCTGVISGSGDGPGDEGGLHGGTRSTVHDARRRPDLLA